MSGADMAEYRIAHLRDRLASEDIAELGVRVEERGGSVMLYGTVSSPACRNEVLRIAREELVGLPLHEDLVVACSDAPTRREELS
ncbi:BON domain-containing protein [Streptomyces sp. Act-28]